MPMPASVTTQPLRFMERLLFPGSSDGVASGAVRDAGAVMARRRGAIAEPERCDEAARHASVHQPCRAEWRAVCSDGDAGVPTLENAEAHARGGRRSGRTPTTHS